MMACRADWPMSWCCHRPQRVSSSCEEGYRKTHESQRLDGASSKLVSDGFNGINRRTEDDLRSDNPSATHSWRIPAKSTHAIFERVILAKVRQSLKLPLSRRRRLAPPDPNSLALRRRSDSDVEVVLLESSNGRTRAVPAFATNEDANRLAQLEGGRKVPAPEFVSFLPGAERPKGDSQDVLRTGAREQDRLPSRNRRIESRRRLHREPAPRLPERPRQFKPSTQHRTLTSRRRPRSSDSRRRE